MEPASLASTSTRQLTQAVRARPNPHPRHRTYPVMFQRSYHLMYFPFFSPIFQNQAC